MSKNKRRNTKPAPTAAPEAEERPASAPEPQQPAAPASEPTPAADPQVEPGEIEPGEVEPAEGEAAPEPDASQGDTPGSEAAEAQDEAPAAQPQPVPAEPGVIRVGRDDLAQALAWVARFLPARPNITVLAGILLDPHKDGLTLSTYDYEVCAQVTVPAVTQNAQRLLLPGRVLASLIDVLPDHPVELAVDGARVVVTCGVARFTLDALPVEDYPALPRAPEPVARLDHDAFAAAVAQVRVAVGKDETLPMLTGVRLEAKGPKVTMAATDRYRLAVAVLNWLPDSAGVEAEVMVPARVLDAARAFGEVDQVEVSLWEDASGYGMIALTGGSQRVIARLMDPSFPDYRKLFPAEFPRQAELEVTPLIDAIRRASVLTGKNRPVRLTFSDGQVLVEVTGDGGEGCEQLPAKWSGEPFTIAFSPVFLLDGLRALGASKAQLRMTEPRRPAVLVGIGEGDKPSDRYKYLLMPVRLGS